MASAPPASASLLSPDLRKRIEIMAEHIARNGSDFENTVRQKNTSNAQFSFLYDGGEGQEYYVYTLAQQRLNGLRPAAPSGGGGGGFSSGFSNGQGVGGGGFSGGGGSGFSGGGGGGFSSSPPSGESDVAAQLRRYLLGNAASTPPTGGGFSNTPPSGGGFGGGGVITPADLPQLLQRWKEPEVYPLAPEVDRQLAEVVQSLEAMASRDAIRNGRAWVERVVGLNSAVAVQLAGTLMRRISRLQTCAHRLHVLYLIHDVLQTEAASKTADRRVIKAFKPFLLWMLRPAYQISLKAPSEWNVGASGTEAQQLLRLVQLWAERGILDPREAEEIKVLTTAPRLPGIVDAPLPPARPPQAPPQPPPPSAPAMGMARHPGMPGMPCGGGLGCGGGGLGCGGMMSGQLGMMQSHMGNMAVMGNMGMQGLQPRLQGYARIISAPVDKHSPETVPVGVLSTMMMHAMRRIGRTNFVPYRPLDPFQTPQMLPPMEVPNQRLMERVEDFYLDLRDEERSSSSDRSSSRSSSRSRSHSRSRSPAGQAKRGGGFDQGGFQQGGFQQGGFQQVAPPMGFGMVPPPMVD